MSTAKWQNIAGSKKFFRIDGILHARESLLEMISNAWLDTTLLKHFV